MIGLNSAKEKMEKALEVVREDLATVQVGRAKPALVEKIKVPAYEGTVLEIRELASITAPEPQQILINPWDKSIINKIVEAISESSLKLSPVIDEELVRIKIPPLTAERRKEVEKLVEMKIESGRKILRNIRNEAKAAISAQKSEAGVSEDDVFEGLKDLQEVYEKFKEMIESLGEEKKKELT
jgi:ribosome recycling factor